MRTLRRQSGQNRVFSPISAPSYGSGATGAGICAAGLQPDDAANLVGARAMTHVLLDYLEIGVSLGRFSFASFPA